MFDSRKPCDALASTVGFKIEKKNNFISQKGDVKKVYDHFRNKRSSTDYDTEQPAFLRVLEN